MIDYSQLVDNIRSFLAAGDQTRTEDVASWAEEYMQWCRLTNDRLRRCQQYLQKGLRAETIHLAEEHPQLLEVATSLDFADVEEWRNTCVQYSLPEPPRILIEIAKSINEAYAEAEPMVELLMRHRMMGLARAPLTDHLAVLRRLAKLDPLTTFWDDDIRGFEKARLEEIRSEVKVLAQSQNVEGLTKLRTEVQGAQWRIAISPDLRQRITSSWQQARVAVAEKMIADLLPALNTAYSAMNLPECRELVERWNQIVQAAEMPISSSIEEQVRPVIQWIEEEDQKSRQQTEFEGACAVLQQALDIDAPDTELERTFRITTAFPLELPPQLDAQYHDRRKRRDAARHHRQTMRYISIAAAGVISLAIVGGGFWQMNRSRQVQTWTKALEEARGAILVDGQLDKAKRVRQSLAQESGMVKNAAPVIKALADLDGAITQEEQRASDFEQAMKQIGQPSDNNVAALTHAKGLAKLAVEKSHIEDLESQIAVLNGNKQEQIDQQFSKDATAISVRIATDLTSQRLEEDNNSFSKKLAEFQSEVEQLAGKGDVSASLRDSMIASLRSKIASQENAISLHSREKALVDEVAASGVSCEQRESALRKYLKALPDGPRAIEFSSALERLSIDKGISTWINLSEGWRSNPFPTTTAQAKSRIEVLQHYQADYPKSPWAETAVTFSKYLEQGIKANAAEGSWKQGLVELMKHPMMQETYVLQTSEMKTYYVPEKPQIKTDSIGTNFLAYITTNLEHPTKVLLPQGVKPLNKFPVTSPQKIFADATLAQIEHLDFNNFEVFGPSIIDDLIVSKINPVLKGLILIQILELNKDTVTGSLAENYDRLGQKLAELRLHNLNWLEPENSTNNASVIQKLEIIFHSIPDIKTIQRDCAFQQKVILQRMVPDIVGQAILLRSGGVWKIVGAVEGNGDVAAYVAPLNQIQWNGNQPDLTLIANRKNGKWTIIPDSLSGVPEGTGVFLRLAKN